MWQAVRQAITGQMKDFDRTLQQLMVHIDALYLCAMDGAHPRMMSFLWRVVQEHFSNPSADKIHRAKQEIESVKQVMLTNIGT